MCSPITCTIYSSISNTICRSISSFISSSFSSISSCISFSLISSSFSSISTRQPSPPKKKRGPTKFQTFAIQTHQVIHFNDKGQPIRENSKKFSSFLGALGRDMVRITIPEWPHVSAERKEELWKLVKLRFEGLIEEHMENTLQHIGNLWKCSKSSNKTTLQIYVRRVLELEKKRKHRNFKKSEFIVPVRDSNAYLDTFSMPMLLTYVAVAIFCHLLMRVADDTQGRGILDELEADGVDTSYLVRGVGCGVLPSKLIFPLRVALHMFDEKSNRAFNAWILILFGPCNIASWTLHYNNGISQLHVSTPLLCDEVINNYEISVAIIIFFLRMGQDSDMKSACNAVFNFHMLHFSPWSTGAADVGHSWMPASSPEAVQHQLLDAPGVMGCTQGFNVM
ncbi:hypothetical protein Sjap_018413 [Stephania japonica]|uniref:Uncharacterized protein n=1 Tax=Stephania japonica TaxID=461633 RepID=A0AAP0I7Z4_9MAGN